MLDEYDFSKEEKGKYAKRYTGSHAGKQVTREQLIEAYRESAKEAEQENLFFEEGYMERVRYAETGKRFSREEMNAR